jgi:hypothetical protein
MVRPWVNIMETISAILTYILSVNNYPKRYNIFICYN